MNLSKSRLRRLRVDRRARDRIEVGSSRQGDDLDVRIDVERALEALPRRQREVTVLRYYLGLDVAQIAETLQISGGTVKTQLFRARKALAIALGDPETEEASGRAEPG